MLTSLGPCSSAINVPGDPVRASAWLLIDLIGVKSDCRDGRRSEHPGNLPSNVRLRHKLACVQAQPSDLRGGRFGQALEIGPSFIKTFKKRAAFTLTDVWSFFAGHD